MKDNDQWTTGLHIFHNCYSFESSIKKCLHVSLCSRSLAWTKLFESRESQNVSKEQLRMKEFLINSRHQSFPCVNLFINKFFLSVLTPFSLKLKDLCAYLYAEHFPDCLASVLEVLSDVMYKHHVIYTWHASKEAEIQVPPPPQPYPMDCILNFCLLRRNLEPQEDGQAIHISPEESYRRFLADLKGSLSQFKTTIWDIIQSKLCTILSGVNLSGIKVNWMRILLMKSDWWVYSHVGSAEQGKVFGWKISPLIFLYSLVYGNWRDFQRDGF